jgi:DUF971 family protein
VYAPPIVALTKIEIVEPERVLFGWDDGRVAIIAASSLRAACPCADCHTPQGERRKQLIVEGAVPVTVSGAHLVGAYGINFTFAPDGHHTGIFTFEQLRRIANGDSGEGVASG